MAAARGCCSGGGGGGSGSGGGRAEVWALIALLLLLWAPAPVCPQTGPATHSSAGQQQQQQQQRPGANLEPANNEKPFASMLNSAVINGKVSLACDISPASPDDSVALILWYKDDSLAPIYTIDARKASTLDKAKVTLDEAYASRTIFNMKSKPAQLQLEPVKQEDEGDYRCRVDFKRGRTVNTIISLRVVVLPDEVRIVTPQKPQQKLEGLIGPFNEGSELTLVCLATGGKPRPRISWRRDYNVIDDTYQHVNKEGTTNELKIPSLSKNHLLSIFTCQASNNNLTSPMQTSITLDLNLKPQEVSLRQLVQEPLVVGQAATFECVTHGSRPQATIHWLFLGIRHEPPMNIDQQQTSSRLTLSLQRTFNQQSLSCVAENPRIAHSSAALHQTIKLDVHYPPQLSIRLEQPIGGLGSPAGSQLRGGHSQPESSDGQADGAELAGQLQLQEGNDIYLTCIMDANPRPLKPILWRLNGRPLQLNSNMIVMNNQSLVLRKVSRLQSGAYTCEASNQYGSNSSRPMELMIRHAPVCSTDDILVFEATVGQTVALDCGVLANPSQSVHFSWFLAPSERNLTNWLSRDAGLDEQVDESSSRLKLRIKNENGFGLLKCKAKNEIGLQQRPCLFQVTKAKSPSLRHTCSLANSSSTSLQIACQRNEHLKSEEFELINNQETKQESRSTTSSASGLSGWLDLEAIRHQSHNQNDQTNSLQLNPTLRLVFPPNWILAELYKLSKTSDEQRDEIGPQNSVSSGQNNYELIAYVVVGSSQQLANIKSIVEENGLFSSNPRSVYYVMTRQINGNNNSDAANRFLESTPNGDHSSALDGRSSEATFQPLRLGPSTSTTATAGRPIEDASIRLADSFTFSVPNLESQSKYKLLLFGQNLANKTRDWLVVKGETLREEPFSRSAMLAANLVAGGTRNSNDRRHDDRVERQNSAFSSETSLAEQQQSTSNTNDQQPRDQTEEAASLLEGGRFESIVSRLAGKSGAFNLTDRVQQLGVYKDLAVGYVKQKPLLIIPAAITTLAALALLILWASNLFVHLIGARKSAPQNATTESQLLKTNESQSSEDSKGSSGERAKQYVQTPDEYFEFQADNLDRLRASPSGQRAASMLLKGDAKASEPAEADKRDTIYSIENDGSLFEAMNLAQFDATELARLYPLQQDHYQHQHQHHHMLGSLDRRQMQQPIYLADGGSFQMRAANQLQSGSVDRRLSSSSCIDHGQRQAQPILITNLAQLEQQGIYIQHQESAFKSQRPMLQETNSGPHCNSSFSSSECAHDHSSGQNGVQARTRQRVAFDLSARQAGESCLYPVDRSPLSSSANTELRSCRRVIVSPSLVESRDAEEELCEQMFRDKQQQQTRSMEAPSSSALVAQGKGSDSGGSNSGNTADSGHESPPTGETNSASFSLNQLHAHNCPSQQLANRKKQAYGAQTAEQFSLSHRAAQQKVAHYQEPQMGDSANGQGNLVMLMELSPVSQESPHTLVQSVDSFADQLHTNHQMVTSFASSNSDCPHQQVIYLESANQNVSKLTN